MKIILNEIKTGAEIWEIIKHPLLKEEDYTKDRNYNFTQYDKITKKGVIFSESKPILTIEEQTEIDNKNIDSNRIEELKTIIQNKQLIKEIFNQEELDLLEKDLIELRTLLGY